jgi:hypothetical protein
MRPARASRNSVEKIPDLQVIMLEQLTAKNFVSEFLLT